MFSMNNAKHRYDLYIQSSEWESRRALYFSTHERKCAACKSKNSIHLHHHTYVRMGKELDEDLVPLCSVCHEEVHKIHNKNRRQNLSAVTFTYIQNYSVVPQPKKRKEPKKKSSKTGAFHRKGTKRAKTPELSKDKRVCCYCNKSGYDVKTGPLKPIGDKHIHRVCMRKAASNKKE